MSADGLILEAELPAYAGIFAELNPYDNPVTTLAMQKGWRVIENQNYTYTTHSNYEGTSANLKPDNASPTYGSSGFSNGSNTVQIWFEAAQETYARRGVQNQGRVLGWKGPSNPSFEPSALQRAKAEALAKIKSEFEYIAREGVLEMNSGAGTTTAWQQRGFRYAPGIQQQLAANAAYGTGAVGTGGTLGTLTRDVLTDGLENAWKSRMWEGGQALTCFTNSTGKRQLTDVFVDEMNLGKNAVSRTEAGVNLERFITDFGAVDVVLTHRMPQDTMYFLNMNEIEAVVRPVPELGAFFEKDFGAGNEKANTGVGIYAEIGLDHGVGSSHIRLTGIGSVLAAGEVVQST